MWNFCDYVSIYLLFFVLFGSVLSYFAAAWVSDKFGFVIGLGIGLAVIVGEIFFLLWLLDDFC